MSKKKNKVVAFTIADNNNLKYAKMLEKSFKKFHPDIPFEIVGEEQIKTTGDPNFFYRATPFVARDLLKKYDTVVKLDADQIITGDLSHTWEGDFDLGVVNNSNPREFKKYPVSVWNIHPLSYVNCGFVVMKSRDWVDHWWKLCASVHFQHYKMREQDLLNIMCFYMPIRVRFLDAGNKWHGLIFKGYEPSIVVRDGKLFLPKNDEWPTDEDKEIVCWHVAGGNVPNKMKYRLHFSEDVVKFIDKLVK